MINSYKTVSEKILTNRRLTISLVVLLTLIFGYFLTKLEVDTNPYFMDRGHPARIHEQTIKEIFTHSGEKAFIAVSTDKPTVFNKATLAFVHSLGERITDISLVTEVDQSTLINLARDDRAKELVNKILGDGRINTADITYLKALNESGFDDNSSIYIDDLIVRLYPVADVRSLASNIENITMFEDELETKKLMENFDYSQESIELLKQEVNDNPIFFKSLISKNNKTTAIQVELNISEEDSANLLRFGHELEKVIASIETTDRTHLGGIPIIQAEVGRTMKRDNDLYFPFVILVVAVLLWVGFRNGKGVVIPLGVAIVSLIWTLGLMAACGVKQNLVTTILPVFLITVAVADAIHILSAYHLADPKLSAIDVTRNVMSKVYKPILLTTITTFIGFLSLSFTELVFIKNFGIFVAIGVVFAFIVTVVLLPAILPSFNRDKISKEHSQTGWSIKLANVLSSLSTSKPKSGVIFLLVLLIGCVVMTSQIKVDQLIIGSFSDATKLRMDDQVLKEEFGGSTPADIWLESSQKGYFSTVDGIRLLETLNDALKSYSLIGYSISPADYIKRLNQVLMERDYELPDDLTNEMVSQFFLLYENSSGQDLRQVVDMTYSNVRIMVWGKTERATVWKDMIDKFQLFTDQSLPEHVTMHVSGFGNTMKADIDEIVTGQTVSLLTSITLITLIMMIIFKSISVGLIAMSPLVVTLLVSFSFMSYFGVHLDIGTSLIVAITFGIGIDYSIHFISNLKRILQQESITLKIAINRTLQEVVHPIVINSIALSAGFAVLTLSGFEPLSQLGLFISGAMVLCGLSALIIIPMLVVVFGPRVLMNSQELETTEPSVRAASN
jgi:predicted RND superfamily exporter protein